jgi:hypothetical protein
MQPSQLTEKSFAAYPPLARALAVQHLALIREMPVALTALLMREVIGYDWLFPAERRTIDDQFAWLGSLSPADRDQALQGFQYPSLDATLRGADSIRRPAEFVETFTAALWSSHQIDNFRAVAMRYSDAWRKAYPEPDPITPRLAIVVLGQDLRAPDYPLFRKLIPHGVYIPAVTPTNAWPTILEKVSARAAKYLLPYGHWYVDGASPQAIAGSKISAVSWDELSTVRTAMLARMQSVIASGHGGPEELRTLMAETAPKDVGLAAQVDDEVLSRFKLSILAEGSGTQIFSTTFVQWTAREALRRAQPCTLLLRFAPRQRQLPMNELLAGTSDRHAVDPAGSLIDADMGAYYTWIDQQRLTGAAQSSFIAWSEAHGQALVISPTAPRGTTAGAALTMKQIFDQFV